MNDSILVVGAGGFIGRHLALRLADDGYQVTAITRRDPGISHTSIHWSAEETPSVDAWRTLLKSVNAVIYLASVSTPGGSAGRPVAEAVSLTHLLTLLEALQTHTRVRLVYMSSAGSLYVPADGKASAEDDAVGPRSYHGASKAAAEAFVGSWCAQFDASATVLRPSNVYGPGQVTRRGFGVIPTAFWHMRHEQAMDVWGDGSQTRDYIHVDDLVDLCVAATKAPPLAGMAVFNAASGCSTSLNKLFQVMEDVAGLTLPRTYHEPRAVDAIHVAVDASKARARFEWYARIGLHEGIEETWRWYRSIEP
ncbi:NAD-dependent epimerase/dehydratase family protein [Luteibacter sp. ME-Dv--P-043b]|uniref:NAD-dependent epimerase/dehydratase family protein n=1 Tax=Luteibacter sp. ME-Dv--P-043b TaxID=3040291 RepID=UPI002553778D|nr:NAD-dependent epimerase/dehydratase family protein [Luteibacter sp. ME-Dv--P-043b]